MPAEWEPQGAVLVAWPHSNTDWNYMLDDAEACYYDLVKAISRHAKAIVIAPDSGRAREVLADLPQDNIFYFETPTNDTWTRDYGVITLRDADGNALLGDFGFNAWGGKFESNLDNGVTRRMFDAGLLRGKYCDYNDFMLEGGSIESDGKGTLLTTESCLLTPTRNASMSRNEIEEKLKETLGVKKVLWLDKGEMIGDDTDGHIDTIARLAPNNTILFNGDGDDNAQGKALNGILKSLSEMTDCDGNPFTLLELPVPDAVYDVDDGHQLPATYANFLVLNDAVLMPTYRQPLKDMHAEMVLKVAFPNHVIERVDCSALIRQHGSLHCATMQLPSDILPF